jgi:hypothetical protein
MSRILAQRLLKQMKIAGIYMKKKVRSACSKFDRRCFFIDYSLGTCDRHLAQQAQQRRTGFKKMGYPEIKTAKLGQVCKVCGVPYSQHELSVEYLDAEGKRWLTTLCNGEFVYLTGVS